MESISFSLPLHHFSFHIPSSINTRINTVIKDILFVFLPEDTTKSETHQHSTSFGIEKKNIRSIIKALVWITIAITIPLLLGQ